MEAKQSEDEDKAKASREDDSSVTLCFQIADEKTVEDMKAKAEKQKKLEGWEASENGGEDTKPALKKRRAHGNKKAKPEEASDKTAWTITKNGVRVRGGE